MCLGHINQECMSSGLTIIYLIFILSINMTETGKKPQKRIPSEIREDPSDSVASTSQVKLQLRKQVQVLRTHFIVCA